MKNETIFKEYKNLNKRLGEVEDVITLGTFDTAVLTLMVFIIALAFSLLSLNAYGILLPVIPPLAISFVYLILFSIFVIFLFQLYFHSIFVKEGRFTNKCICLAILKSMGFFLSLLIVILFLLWKNYLPEKFAESSVMILFLISIAYAFWEFFKIKKYFKENLKYFIARREKEIKRINKENDKKR